MEVRTNITTIALLLALCSILVYCDDPISARLFDETATSPVYNDEDHNAGPNVDEDARHLFHLISRLLGKAQTDKDDTISPQHFLTAGNGGDISVHSPQLYGNFDIVTPDDFVDGDTVIEDYDKRGRRCRNGQCVLHGVNPNANSRPLPYGKRSRNMSQSRSVSQPGADMSNKRGRARRLRPVRVLPRKDFLPFGRR